MKNLSPLAAALGALLFVIVGCTDPEPDGPSVVSSVAPAIETVNCPVESATPPADWPLAIPDSLVVTDYTVVGNTYTALGVSNDGEALLNSALEDSLADYDTDEPDGGASDLIVTFESAQATGSLFMTDENGDDCWDVDLTIAFLSAPESGEFVPTEPESGGPAAGPEEADGIDGSNGSAAVTTAGGTFQLSVISCQMSPVLVEAASADGQIRIEDSGGGQVGLTWTYPDGTIVSDSDANAVISSSTTGLFVGDGQGAEGPETVLADIACDSE